MKKYPLDLFLPENKPGPFPLICITPLLGRLILFEDLYFERRFARFFTSQGFAAAVLHRPVFEFDFQQGLEQLERYLQETVRRNREILDGLVQRKEIDPHRIGTFGISFGAVVNCLWAAQDARLKAHVFALAGGNLIEILTSSKDPLVRTYLRDALKSSGLGLRGLRQKMKELFHSDPLEVCHQIPKENVLLIIALFDRVVPIRFALDLRRRLRNPETLFIPVGHYLAILAAPFLKGPVCAFFRKRFA